MTLTFAIPFFRELNDETETTKGNYWNTFALNTCAAFSKWKIIGMALKSCIPHLKITCQHSPQQHKSFMQPSCTFYIQQFRFIFHRTFQELDVHDGGENWMLQEGRGWKYDDDNNNSNINKIAKRPKHEREIRKRQCEQIKFSCMFMFIASNRTTADIAMHAPVFKKKNAGYLIIFSLYEKRWKIVWSTVECGSGFCWWKNITQ